MWKKFENLKAIADTGILLIIRLDDESEALAVAEAAIAGGIKALEVTLSVPNALGVISTLSKKYKDQGILIGAGTVLDAETARAAILAGAELLVSPHVTTSMIQMANRYQAVSVCGAYTPTESVAAIEAGADIVKLFPADMLGPKYVKTIKAPLEQAPIAPTGGVTPENAREWFAAGCVSVGVGSYISKAAQGTGDYSKVTEAAKTFLAAVKDARSSL
ncbi:MULTISPECIES: bifunctional 4-hydroxy-2-oxoglutarate aldolase/2-dehydro-3-deoxy-phosphogluconate aldolase [Marinomonas]|jgi:2-keto-3-deoxy-phosphogluconate aldolase (EC 4.1.2.14)|uniref:2-dehydro-3-deoxyphosphogluconate aldolase/4-hydroxy-2-oxoglutarate aldolase n=2 Tax=Marinomonas TaxID=28253 RepID=F2JX79_MARM1|nr:MULTISPECIES: bifunctional 4-hydroxy-2-oxoglutarate aldolase/2-dehydro-3-deoxy-phosphogluconate aldolase [Marinomonas]ADZ90685.1 2-dehydro-3-deoxyphosphogluconate aldolase/4-hydroxy-2-oxoglutarate aldolase [Marinomonas mediterranea MMB-1]TDO98975.1 2-dehydro-3-deoxyphosphogluconate aldolase/(4S)-4-hydroxy-2-oxoglutarate aldolase [Marinomonas balearica]WCN08733.1 bifunctional 4-hydroxy-2-oxoglutarate aldolase/2-dehydro-3-deoxy-phosphogluconate aldolase [Marinomonas mediterranea]WCN12779.1 bif